MKQEKLKVYLSETSPDVDSHRSFLYQVLKKAELEVISLDVHENTEKSVLSEKIQKAISLADCSIHIIGNTPETVNGTDGSVSEIQLLEAGNHSKNIQTDFRIFIWQPVNASDNSEQNEQDQFIASIRNSVLQNITISNHASPVSFVEDLYSVMNAQTQSEQKGKDSEIFFIHNELDKDFAKEIIELLDDVLTVEELAMIQNSERDYSGYIMEQAKKSKLIVVFFKWSSNWIVPFVQQLWRLTGGASSTTPVMVIADTEHESQFQNQFKMPNVMPYFVSEELIPLEIKVQYDRITNQ